MSGEAGIYWNKMTSISQSLNEILISNQIETGKLNQVKKNE